MSQNEDRNIQGSNEPMTEAQEKEAAHLRDLEQTRRQAKREKMARRKIGISGKIASAFLDSKLTPLLIVASLLVGLLAVTI
ncbi:hypothetical protein KKG66_07725, partial [bacterium]|nr:hypothetical protein [bacterium]